MKEYNIRITVMAVAVTVIMVAALYYSRWYVPALKKRPFKGNLTIGSKGSNVVRLQLALNKYRQRALDAGTAANTIPEKKLFVDGFFGETTAEALISYKGNTSINSDELEVLEKVSF